MADPRGFLRVGRENPVRRPVELRIRDWHEVYLPLGQESLERQASRCMDCGIPFCHEGCPLGNLIPEWNDLVYRGQMDQASERLHATNNFPDFTGRLCPAPCEGSCVLGINAEPVAIKQVELEIAEFATGAGLAPVLATRSTQKRVAIVGSGPSGLACAQQLTRAGHDVVVFERAERAGGLLRYGVPEFKLEKRVIDQRITQMKSEGTTFRTQSSVGPLGSRESLAASSGATVISIDTLRDEFDAVVLAIGSTVPRDLDVSGRDLGGVHFAMDYLRGANLVCEGTLEIEPISARGARVIIIGGGDTGADCLGTVHRQGARSVIQLEILPEPPGGRSDANPWPTWPVILRSYAAHEEGGERMFSISTSEFKANSDGRVAALLVEQVTPRGDRSGFDTVEGSRTELPADLVLLALGFTGPDRTGIIEDLGLTLTPRANIAVDASYMTPSAGVFACGDAVRGQSLVVWAIAEGRSTAASVDRFLMGETDLPAPLLPGTMALV